MLVSTLGGNEERFIGGMRVSLRGRTLEGWSWGDVDCANASRPLAELTIKGSSLRVRLRYRWLRRLLGQICPVVEVSLDGLHVRPIGSTPMTRAVVINGTSGGKHRSVVFWCSKATQARLLDVLQRRGVTVE
jgi:hypothetical protein